MLPSEDRERLEAKFPQYSEMIENQMVCVVLPDFPLPRGLQPSQSDLLLMLAPGYPDIPPDMWWFDPPVIRPDGQAIPQTQVQENYLGRKWQRWSRHLDPGLWRPGVDSLESYLSLVQSELAKAA